VRRSAGVAGGGSDHPRPTTAGAQLKRSAQPHPHGSSKATWTSGATAGQQRHPSGGHAHVMCRPRACAPDQQTQQQQQQAEGMQSSADPVGGRLFCHPRLTAASAQLDRSTQQQHQHGSWTVQQVSTQLAAHSSSPSSGLHSVKHPVGGGTTMIMRQHQRQDGRGVRRSVGRGSGVSCGHLHVQAASAQLPGSTTALTHMAATQTLLTGSALRRQRGSRRVRQMSAAQARQHTCSAGGPPPLQCPLCGSALSQQQQQQQQDGRVVRRSGY
jgi:hypothetical protein